METAYRELYQEFVHLRSICLRQAALLNKLMKTLQQAKGIPNGNLTSKHTQEFPAHFQPKPMRTYSAAAQTDPLVPSSNENTSHLLAEDVSKLSMNAPDGKAQQMMSLGQDSLTNTFSCDVPSGGGSLKDSQRMSLSDSQLFGFDLPSLPGGRLMSDLTLQSHECDFCQAVFPRHTTTRGEFLQHLHKHFP
ncbi:uncharacterized protein LOC144075764 isoform X2 [Stigmatopora argus]